MMFLIGIVWHEWPQKHDRYDMLFDKRSKHDDRCMSSASAQSQEDYTPNFAYPYSQLYFLVQRYVLCDSGCQTESATRNDRLGPFLAECSDATRWKSKVSYPQTMNAQEDCVLLIVPWSSRSQSIVDLLQAWWCVGISYPVGLFCFGLRRMCPGQTRNHIRLDMPKIKSFPGSPSASGVWCVSSAVISRLSCGASPVVIQCP